MIIVSGKTYPWRSQLKALGLYWHPASKTWRANSVKQHTLDALSEMRGIIVHSADGDFEPQDNRTYKQKYGRCEDAPCCGCCGPQGDGDYYGSYGDY